MSARQLRTTVTVLFAAFALAAVADGPQLAIGSKPKPMILPVAGVIEPGAVTGGKTAEYTLQINDVVEQDTVVTVQTDRPEAYRGFPETVIVASGRDSVTVELRTVEVSGPMQTTVTASYGGGVADATLTVNP